MKYYFTLIILALALQSYSQTTISGRITDQKNKPVSGASISINDSYDGSTSDSLGHFHFNTSETGKKVLLITAIGYEDRTDTVNIGQQPVEVTIALKSKTQSLDAVVITAGSFAAGDQTRSTELSTLDVVTTASANADITGAIKTLPGTQQVGESEGLFVRGGTADESKIYIDGTLVNNFFFSSQPGQSSRGRFSPFLFKGTVFSSGGYSALYGQALSSVLLLESIDLPDRTSASLGLSYLSANAGIQKLAKNKRSSWGANYAYVNLGLVYGLIRQKNDYTKVPEVHELDLNYRVKTSSSGMFKYYGYFTHSKLRFRYQDVDSTRLKDAFEVANLNIYQNVSWRERFNNGWALRLGASYSNNRDDIRTDLESEDGQKVPEMNDPLFDNKSFQLNKTGNYVNGRWTLEKKLGGLSAIRFGNEYQYSNELLHFSNRTTNQGDVRLRESLLASYVESDIYLMPKLALRTGLRSEHSQLFDSWNLSPRLSLAYRFPDKGQVSVAYGIFYQNPSGKYLPTIDQLHFEKATHYILQYQKMTNNRILRIESFYKKYNDLVKSNDQYGKLTAINNNGFGDAKGIELFWRDKKTFRNFDYWFSYSYLDTRRDFLNYPYEIRPPFASKHTASLVTKTFILTWKLQVNMSYTFASGRPYYDIYQTSGGQFAIRHDGTTRSYNDLSLSLNYLPTIGKKDAKSFSVFVLSVTNVPGFHNVYTYNFSADGRHKVAVTPPAKRFYYLGYFVSFGIDRTQEAIDNQL